MPELDVDLRNQLEKRVIEARDISEAAAAAALKHLGVAQKDAPAYLTEPQRHLRRALRAKARQLGDPLEHEPADPTPALERELAYERWHQMLFAAFLAHNDLLMHPTGGTHVTLTDCMEFAADEGDPDGWHTAARYASHMLPGIFKPTDPLLQVRYAPEDHQALERILDDIPPPSYTSDDGLGWVYQFWQTKRKKQVNESGVKIGGADISPVTQLFTEHYMVQFLLHNTLGAWWTARHPDIPLPTNKSYLRTLDDGTPAAGTFDGWPTTAKDITVMDPCCGSGHFLIAAFTLLQRFRMLEEDLTEAEAGDAVLRDNLHGLELDPRCTQLAAFSLALHAWKRGGYRPLPPMNIACSGIPAGGSESDWTDLTDDPRAKNALKRLHHLFKHAPDLGSLIDPNRLGDDDPLYTANYNEIETLLDQALGTTDQTEPATNIFGDAARGIAHAARLLAGKYTLVATNVPYLTRNRFESNLRAHVDLRYRVARADLATAFIMRLMRFAGQSATQAIVGPQNWLFLSRYTDFRVELLRSTSINVIARLGEGAFESPQAAGAFPVLSVLTNGQPPAGATYLGIDASGGSNSTTIAQRLADGPFTLVPQGRQAANPRTTILTASPLEDRDSLPLLEDYAAGLGGITTSDAERFRRSFWELRALDGGWVFQQAAPEVTTSHAGRSRVLLWEEGIGQLADLGKIGAATIAGRGAWGRRGVAVQYTRSLNATLYSGSAFENVCAVIIPRSQDLLAAVWAYVSSSDYAENVRRIDSKTGVTCNTLVKVPFDLARSIHESRAVAG